MITHAEVSYKNIFRVFGRENKVKKNNRVYEARLSF